MASITLKNIRKTYEDGVTVIDDLNLEFNDKEFIILVGPSGCGKSTTLRMIAGLEEISSGELYIGDRLVNDISPKDRDIAMAFQSYALYPHMSVYNNMAFGLKNRKVSKEEIDKKVRAAAKMLDIESYLNRKPRALSGGQRQRVALGRAMVREPAVFLLDEPLSNLDAKLRTEMRSRISMLHKELQTTFVYVTHDQTEAMTMADRIVVMKSGEIMQFDTPHKLYHHPENLFVAGFIGSPQMNFIDSKIIKKSNGYSAIFGDYEVKLPQRMNNHLVDYESKTVVLGIRPEDLSLCKNYEKENTVSLFIDIAEMTGADCILYGNLCGKKFVANLPSSSDVKSETECYLKIDTEKIHLFDKITEKLICD